jgi:ABC-2 type transport system ATP-binding protein
MSDGYGFEDVSVRLRHSLALDHVSFQAHPGEIVVVVGGDGAGKSTLCRTLARLIAPSQGRVVGPPDHRVGYLPPSSGVWLDLTVAENLAFVAAAYRLGGEESRRRRQLLLEATGLGPAADRVGSQLSGGMRQKLGLAMALLPEPPLLVLDEPTTGIDPVSRFELWRLIARSAAHEVAVVLTTTYLEEAERATAVLALDEGSTLAWGRPEEVNASLAGKIFASAYAVDQRYRWRRGTSWRYWSPSGMSPPGAHPVEPDLSDILTAAALAREEDQG